MTARDIMTPLREPTVAAEMPLIAADMGLLDILPRLADAPGRELAVVDDEGHPVGLIGQAALIDALNTLIAPRDDASTIVVETAPEDYSPSLMAHAVEDVDAPVTDLFCTPGHDGKILVTMRVRHSDPSAAVRSLERYNFKVVEAYGPHYYDLTIANEHLQALQMYLNV